MGTNSIKYPRFISSKPCGIDKFEGKSQEKLTNAIANHIVSVDIDNNAQQLPRIIGLEGGWGVGKSNVIKQLNQQLDKQNKIKNKYCLFEYDAWGHQEDIQRRSFLETLTSQLIHDKTLSGKTKLRRGDKKGVTWQKKLDDLLAHKITRTNKSLPKFNAGALLTALFLSLTPITVFIAERLENAEIVKCICLLILIAFAPILFGVILWFVWSRFDRDMRGIGWFLQISKSENIETVNTETINEEQPNVAKFKNWMQDISDHIGKDNKKLIIVYDNMDRLPAEKVKELWSSIHTFFSEDGFENIWAIIPFDEKHLSCAFGEDDNEERKKLTRYFISKTFPIVYRVTPPVITDFKIILDNLFMEAFDNTISDEQKDLVNRIFRLEKPNATVREMIEFINQIVALKNIWHNEIDILYISIFVLKKDVLLLDSINTEKITTEQTIAEKILSGEYLGQYITNIAPNDEVLQKNISALVYGISPNDAEQIPMLKYLDGCLRAEENYDINKFSNKKHFITILSEKIKNADIAQINNIIHCFTQLNVNIFSENDKIEISSIWNTIAQKTTKNSLEKQEFDENYKQLLLHIDNEQKQTIVKHLCNQIQTFKNFAAANYYKSLRELDEFLKTNVIEIKIADNLSNLGKTPEVFVDYVLSAKENYLLYKLTVKPDELVKYLSDRVIDKYSVLEALKYLIKDKQYQFNPVKEKIEVTIQNQQLIGENNFKPLFGAYKILSNEKPLSVQLSPNQRQIIWNTLASKPNTTDFLEIVAMDIATGTNRGVSLSNNTQIKYIADNLDYYANYGELLINNLSWNIPILNQVLKYMTENKLGHRLSLESILPKFFEIKNNLGVNETILLEQFNGWEGHKNSITSSNIQQILPNAQFFQFSKTTKNALTDYLNTTIIETLSNISTDALYQQPSNSYWIQITSNLIDTEFLKSLPDNLTELSKRYLDDIAASRLAIPTTNDYIHKLIEKLDRRKTKETITNIRNQICNGIYSIDANKFLYLHEWLEKQGDLHSRAGEVCQYILSPVTNNDNCLNIIIEKTDFYANIINLAETQADTLKSSIKNNLSNSTDTKLISFAKRIGVKKEKQ